MGLSLENIFGDLGRLESGISRFLLTMFSVFNFLLTLIFLGCLYVTTDMQGGRVKRWRKLCGELHLIRRLVFWWSTFKICFSVSLLLVFLLRPTTVSGEERGVILLLAASAGFLMLQHHLAQDLSTLSLEDLEQDVDRGDVMYRPLSTEEKIAL